MKKLIIAVATITISTTIALALIEGTLRLSKNFNACKNFDSQKFSDSRNYSLTHGFYEPNSAIDHCNQDFRYVYHIDKNGLRQSSNEDTKTLSIGDSFTFGFGVADTKTYSYLIDSKNGGLWGNTFDVQHKSYIRNIELFHPKTVVWTIYPPHLISLTQSNWSTNCPGDFEITLDRFGISEQLFKPIQSSLLNKSALYTLILKKLGLISIKVEDNRILINKNCYETKEVILYDKNIIKTEYLPPEKNPDINNEMEDAYAKLASILMDASLVAKNEGIQLFFVIIPSKYYLNSYGKEFLAPNYPGYEFNRDIARSRIFSLLTQAGVSNNHILDASDLEELKDNNWKKYYFRNDAHLNEDGNALIAKYISKKLLKN